MIPVHDTLVWSRGSLPSAHRATLLGIRKGRNGAFDGTLVETQDNTSVETKQNQKKQESTNIVDSKLMSSPILTSAITTNDADERFVGIAQKDEEPKSANNQLE
jgi:hypothetical protein